MIFFIDFCIAFDCGFPTNSCCGKQTVHGQVHVIISTLVEINDQCRESYTHGSELCNEILNSWSLIPRASQAGPQIARQCDVTLSGSARRFCHWLVITIFHHLAVELLYIKSAGKALCLNPSVVKGCVNSKYWISKDQSLTVQIQWSLPDGNEQIGKVLSFLPLAEESVWTWVTLSPLRCSKTGKEIFPKPIKVISYSQTIVSLSQVSGLGKQLFV